MTMRTPIHHPPEPVLTAAAIGELSPAVSRIVQAHAGFCSQCRRAMQDVEAIAAACFSAEDGVPMEAGALDRALAAIDALSPQEPAPDSRLLGLPQSVLDIIGNPGRGVTWRYAGPGLKILDIELPEAGTGETLQVLRIEPGHGAPRHTHRGLELTLVVAGAFADSTGTFGPGDLAFSGPSLTHRPIAQPGEICIALAATTAPLRFTGTLGVIQTVFGAPGE